MQLREFINDAILQNSKYRNKKSYLLDHEEVQVAKNMVKVLRPFKEMTIMLSESKLTNSHALPILFYLQSNLKNLETDTRDLIKMKSLLRECLNFYITKFGLLSNVTLICSTFLDPVNKKFSFADQIGDISPAQFIETAKDFIRKRNDKINTNLIRNQIKKPNLENKMNSSYKSFLTQSLERSKMPNSNMSIEEEIASYELLPVSTDTTFSIFWSQNEKKLPLLAQIVRSVCCAPPTTVSSEQDFSMGSDIVTQKRNKLSDKRVECLSFLKRNLSREFSYES